MKSNRLIQTALLAAVLIGTAGAEPMVTILHPAGTVWSEASGNSGTSQVGSTTSIAGVTRARLWSGTSSSMINLHPSVATNSVALGTDGLSQVGSVTIGNQRRASIWTGHVATWINLHPASVPESVALAVSGNRQVGFTANSPESSRACLWNGSSSSWVSLHSGVNSMALGVSDSNQVGWINYGGGSSEAFLWYGTAGARVQLHPIGAAYSVCNATNGPTQVGVFTRTFGGEQRACLWSGTSGSMVDLHPFGSSYSAAYGVSDAHQVGFAYFAPLDERAILWSGDRSLWINLHDLLPIDYRSSVAKSVSKSGDNLSIVGFAVRSSTNQKEAVVWTVPLSSLVKVSGEIVLQNTSVQGEPGAEDIAWQLFNEERSFGGRLEVNRIGGGSYKFQIPISAPTGAYTLRFKGGSFLSRSAPVFLGSGDISLSVSLPNGDSDQDGEVGPSDFEAVVAQFGASGSGDLDNDGEVGPSDFEIVVANFGLQDQ